jgi:hypothetical protein
LECDWTFTPEYHDFFISDLIGQTHIGRDPSWLINLVGWDFLPDISLNVINFNHIYNVLLIDSSPECEQVLVFETTKCNSSSWDL